jgi:hypothetical protein
MIKGVIKGKDGTVFSRSAFYPNKLIPTERQEAVFLVFDSVLKALGCARRNNEEMSTSVDHPISEVDLWIPKSECNMEDLTLGIAYAHAVSGVCGADLLTYDELQTPEVFITCHEGCGERRLPPIQVVYDQNDPGMEFDSLNSWVVRLQICPGCMYGDEFEHRDTGFPFTEGVMITDTTTFENLPVTNNKLIKCEDHADAPWSFLCCHLVDSEAPIDFFWSTGAPRHPDGIKDAACKQCWEDFKSGETAPEVVSGLIPSCLHCAREILDRHTEKGTITE